MALRRWLIFTGGLHLLGLGIALMVRAQVGLGPWGVLHQGISLQVGIPLGLATVVVGIVLLLLWLPLGQRPGYGTPINIVVVGLLIDGFLWLLPPAHAETLPVVYPLIIQVLQAAAGVVLVGVGSGLYVSAGLGTGPRDGVMLGLARRTGLSLRLARTLMEITALTSGWLLGGTVGIGTIFFALGIGPIIQKTLHVARSWQATP